MIPWYLITTDDEPWKVPVTVAHLGEHGIAPKVLLAFTGHSLGLRTITPHDIDASGSASYMHPAQLGCVLSHLMALRCAIADGPERFIIAENDVLLPPNFNEKFDCFVKAVPDDAGIVQMQHFGELGPAMDRIGTNYGSLHHCIKAFGTACILWTRSAAQQALAMLRPIDSPFDVMLIRKVYPFLKHYAIWPTLVSDRTSGKEWPSSVQDH